jgi:3-oxoadipate enol-lactonase
MKGTSKNGLYYEIDGNGPWLILSHSLACNLHMWDPQMELLTQHFKVLRFDTRGHGKSVVTPGPYSLDSLADDVFELMQELAIEKMHWMGLSMGGMIGQTMILRSPESFLSIVLADTPSQPPDDAFRAWRNNRDAMAREHGMQSVVNTTLNHWFTEGYRNANPPELQEIANEILTTPVEGFVSCSAAIAHINTFDRLKEINCLAMVMVGEHDEVTAQEIAEKIHAEIVDSILHIIPNAAHISNVEQRDLFNQHITDFYKLNVN